MTKFQGVIPPICTPLTADGRVDRESLARLIDFQLDAGVHGLFVLGSSGEAIYLSDADRVEVVETTMAHVAGRVPVIVGILDSTPLRVIQQAHLLAPFDPAAFVATAPFYANVSEREMAEHFRTVAAAIECPLLAYDIPGNVGRRIPVQVVSELLADGTIVGLKDSSGSLGEFRKVLDARRDAGEALLTGADLLADLALSLGADGLIPGLANVRPDLFVRLYNAHLAGRTQEVAVYQKAITALVDIFGVGERYGLGRHASELGALKNILHSRGVIETTVVSSPLGSYSPEALAALAEVVDRVSELAPGEDPVARPLTSPRGYALPTVSTAH